MPSIHHSHHKKDHHKKAHEPKPSSSKPLTVHKKWNFLSITYNVSNKPPDQKVINQILETTIKNTDLSFVVISLQEIRTSERFGMHWDDTWRELLHISLWELGFLCIANSYMITNLLLVFSNFQIAQLVDSCKFSYSKDYYNGAKGTICALVRLRGDVNFIFMGSHFVHDAKQLQKRIVEINSVRTLVRLAKQDAKKISAILWAGDLNFRNVNVEANEFSLIAQKQDNAKMMELVEKYDQLASLKDLDGITSFVDEAPINFLPTYRYIINGNNEFDLLRVPSWTDRILFDNLRSVKYDSIQDCNFSDHQPVYSHLSFECDKEIRSGWEVDFHEINTWYSGVPLHISFNGKEFWKRNGSYRDWLGVYKVPVVNERCTISYTNIMLCIDYGDRYMAEFISLPEGKYIVAYHSHNDLCIKGMTNVFKVTNFE